MNITYKLEPTTRIQIVMEHGIDKI